jgi:hypothetical protein
MAERSQTTHIYDSSGQIDSTGSSNAYVIRVAEQISAYHRGMAPIRFKANFSNSGSATANIATELSPSGLGAVTMKKGGGASDLASGDIVSGGVYTLIYDGTFFQVLEQNATAFALADDAVTNAKLANMAEATIKGRAVGAGTGDPQDLTATQATAILNAFTDLLKGLVPASGGGTANFLRADATWAAPGGITAGTVQATTSGSAIDFTGLPAAIKRITIAFDGVSLSGTDSHLVQIGDSGGVETTGYSSASGTNNGTAVGVTVSTTGFCVGTGAAGRAISGHMILTRITGNQWISSHSFGDEAQTDAFQGGGRKTLSDELTTVRITRSGTNTFDAGQVNIFYE